MPTAQPMAMSANRMPAKLLPVKLLPVKEDE